GRASSEHSLISLRAFQIATGSASDPFSRQTSAVRATLSGILFMPNENGVRAVLLPFLCQFLSKGCPFRRRNATKRGQDANGPKGPSFLSPAEVSIWLQFRRMRTRMVDGRRCFSAEGARSLSPAPTAWVFIPINLLRAERSR